MTLQSIKPSNSLPLLTEKIKKTPALNKCQAALAGTAIPSAVIGTVSLVACAILLKAAPLLIPAIAFTAVLIAGAALLLIGTFLTVALVAMVLKKRPQPPIMQNVIQNPLIAQNQDLANQLKIAHTEKHAVENEMQTLQEKFQAKSQELNVIQNPLIAQNQDLANQLKIAHTEKQAVENEMQTLQEKFQAKSQELIESQNKRQEVEIEKKYVLERQLMLIRKRTERENQKNSAENTNELNQLQQTIQEMEENEVLWQSALENAQLEVNKLRIDKQQLEEKFEQLDKKIPLSEIEIQNKFLQNKICEQEIILERYKNTYGSLIEACVTTPMKQKTNTTDTSNRGLLPRPNILTMDLTK